MAQCYKPENGRPGIEPVVLLGVLIFQFLERVPDRQAAELVKYHLGWKLVSNCVSKSNIFSFAAGELLPWSIRRVPLSDSNW